jgi:hypothetical protein
MARTHVTEAIPQTHVSVTNVSVIAVLKQEPYLLRNVGNKSFGWSARFSNHRPLLSHLAALVGLLSSGNLVHTGCGIWLLIRASVLGGQSPAEWV